MRSRAIRRKEVQKKKKKAASFGDSYKKLYNHLASCSCFMCGNPRKWFKEKTIKEQMQGDWDKLKGDWDAL